MRSLGYLHFFALLGGSAAACGGDDDDPAVDAGADANLPDAALQVVRAGTMAIAQNTVINPAAAGIGGLSGATVSIVFNDLTTVTVPPLPGFENPIGGCQITAYDLAGGDVETVTTDEGNVTIAGTNHEPFGCGFNPADGLYHCQSATAAHASGAAVGVTATTGATITFAFAGTPFVADALKGGFVIFAGFTEDADASSSPFNGKPLPVVANTTGAIVVANTVGYAGAATGQAGATFANFLGENPVPGTFQFLDDGDSVAITKTASARVGAIDTTVQPNGIGADLDDASALPYGFPAAAAGDLVFSCDGANGSCAEDGKGSLNVMTISGEASDGSLVGLSPFEMPDDPDTKVVFQCSSLSVGSVTMPEAAVQAILDRDPTRVRISIGLFAGQFAVDGVADDDTRLLVGNLLTGFTDL